MGEPHSSSAPSPGAATTSTPAPANPASNSPPQHDSPISAGSGDHDSDNDSSLDVSDAGSSTASLASSILKYRQENGRTYHAYKDGAYFYPNDDREQERLDLQHNLYLLTLDNRLHIADLPKGSVHNVLDLGTGTGIWAIDFADEHPEAHILGVDLSPIQPSFVPANVTFQVDDLEDEWTFGPNQFDFIYSRMNTGSITDWPRLFGRALNALVPGGSFEIADIAPTTSDDGTYIPGSPLAKWSDLIMKGSRSIGRPCDTALQYKEQLEAAGFVNVRQTIYKWPINQWPRDPKLKEIGLWVFENFNTGLNGMSLALFTRVLGWTNEQLELFLVDVRKDLKNQSIHAYWPVYFVTGEKPK